MYNAMLFMQVASAVPWNFVILVATRQSGLNTAAAGYVMFCAFNCILMLLLGSGLVWFGEEDYYIGGRGASSAIARGPAPNFAAPATFASPLSGGGARAYVPGGSPGTVTISAAQ